MRAKRFPQALLFTPTLTEKIHSYRIAPKYGPLRSGIETNDEP